LTGGAAIAANRLKNALNRSGAVEARMLVRDMDVEDPDVSTIPQGYINKFRFLWERGVIWMNNRFSKNNLFHVSIANTGYDVTRTKAFKQADIIHLHWTQQGMLSLHDIERILKSGKPVVWTMHDMWLCTSICHHSEECEKYTTHCDNCQYLSTDCKNDLSYRVFDRKRRIFGNSSFTVVTCSRWLGEKAENSALLQGHRIVTIPNPIDTELFKPMNKSAAREMLGLPKERRLVLFASQKVTDKRKGIDYFVKAAELLKANGDEMEFVIMGQKSEQIQTMMPYPCHPMGYVSSPEQAALIYNACDLFVTPSLMENLPNTIMESLSCGVPCVGFNVGGIPEMIENKANGYLAQFMSAEDFARGISWCLDRERYDGLCAAARQSVEARFSEKVVAEQFISLYKSIIEKN